MLTEKPLTGTIGTEIEGLDLAGEVAAGLNDDLAAALRDALARRHVIVFRDQNLGVAGQKMLTRAFGPLKDTPYVTPLDGEPQVIRVAKAADETGGTFGGDWHSDYSFLEEPPAGSVLSAVEVPPVGGDTLWASQAAAWEALPPPLQELLLGRDAIHVGKPYGVKWAPPMETRAGASMKMTRGDPAADAERRHPAVLENPATGRRMLYLNPTYVCRLDGMSEEESRPILEAVQRHTTRPEFCCRLRWSPGAVAVWDNFATQHYAVNDYFGYARLMYRTTFGGPRPEEIAALPHRHEAGRAAE